MIAILCGVDMPNAATGRYGAKIVCKIGTVDGPWMQREVLYWPIVKRKKELTAKRIEWAIGSSFRAVSFIANFMFSSFLTDIYQNTDRIFSTYSESVLSGSDSHSCQLMVRPGNATAVNHQSSDNHFPTTENSFSSSPLATSLWRTQRSTLAS